MTRLNTLKKRSGEWCGAPWGGFSTSCICFCLLVNSQEGITWHHPSLRWKLVRIGFLTSKILSHTAVLGNWLSEHDYCFWAVKKTKIPQHCMCSYFLIHFYKRKWIVSLLGASIHPHVCSLQSAEPNLDWCFSMTTWSLPGKVLSQNISS